MPLVDQLLFSFRGLPNHDNSDLPGAFAQSYINANYGDLKFTVRTCSYSSHCHPLHLPHSIVLTFFSLSFVSFSSCFSLFSLFFYFYTTAPLLLFFHLLCLHLYRFLCVTAKNKCVMARQDSFLGLPFVVFDSLRWWWEIRHAFPDVCHLLCHISR
jgi:hypothetical protein